MRKKEWILDYTMNSTTILDLHWVTLFSISFHKFKILCDMNKCKISERFILYAAQVAKSWDTTQNQCSCSFVFSTIWDHKPLLLSSKWWRCCYSRSVSKLFSSLQSVFALKKTFVYSLCYRWWVCFSTYHNPNYF